MPGDIQIVFNEVALALLPTSVSVRAGTDRLASQIQREMKRIAPVSPVFPVYARPIPLGRSRGQVYRGRGLARPGGPVVPRLRRAGDFPLNVSGRLRQSITIEHRPFGEIKIGPTVDYARYPNDGTRPHIIRSHGPWPLRNRATGQVFGPVVHHPGNRGQHFVERAALSVSGARIHV